MNPNIAAQLEDTIANITDQFKGLESQLKNLTGTLQNLVTSGLAATAEGNKLSYAWTLLSRQIASVFLPAINWLIEKILKLTEWFRGLSGENQSLLMKVGLLIGAFLAMATVATVLMSVISPVSLMVSAVAAALYYFFTQTELGKVVLEEVTKALIWMVDNWYVLVNVFELVGGALKKIGQLFMWGMASLGNAIIGLLIKVMEWIPGLGEATDGMKKFHDENARAIDQFANDILKPIELSQKPQKGKGGPNNQVNPTGFNFESLSASFERITSEANKKDLAMDIAKQQLKVQEQIAAGVVAMANNGWGETQGGGGDF